MFDANQPVPRRTVTEWTLHSETVYANPFADVAVDAIFTAPSGHTYTMPAFYDGGGNWRIRFNPVESGLWHVQTRAVPSNTDLEQAGSFTVVDRPADGYLCATPGQAWGFSFESGKPVFLFGDTVYNLFGMAYCGADVTSFLERRAQQGFNLLRIRVPVSPFHPPNGYSAWQTRRTWPWGGSEQAPRFDRFNLDYFKCVDEVVKKIEVLGLGIEMIMEAWGFEFPFNSRQIFTAEWEELWLRYLIARYDAYNCLYIWTPLNEYEYYPNGDWHYKPVSDRWAMRIARWIKGMAPHGHIVAMHNGPREPAFAERFKADPDAVDAIMFQEWGTRDSDLGWLAAGIEERIEQSLAGWQGSAVLAEWGYERNPAFDLLLPTHEFCDEDHTRRGAWRGVFSGLGIIHGWENSWGPWELLSEDQPGMDYLLQVKRFLTEITCFADLRPAPEIVLTKTVQSGHQAMVLASLNRETVAAYLPVGASVALHVPPAQYVARWFDPRTGDMLPATPAGNQWQSPGGGPEGRPWDWVLLLESR